MTKSRIVNGKDLNGESKIATSKTTATGNWAQRYEYCTGFKPWASLMG